MAHSMQNTFERRLRPIYDNLEVGNNRKALQETDKLLKKHPNLLCGRALKGLALLKLGRFEESHNYLESVTNEKPIDEPTLQVLTFCYKELEQFDKIVDLFNHAVKQSPGNEELLAHLFISYVRLEDFKSQQSVALQLYKTAPKSSYYFWSVISTVLQATRGPEKDNPDKKRIFLTLAQRMTDKVIEENKLESEQEALLYLRILKLQSKHKEALEFYETPICQQLCPEAIEMKIELMKNLDMWQEINIELKKLLLKDLDRWDYHKDFIKSCLILQKNYLVDSELTENHQNVDHLQECYDFINQLIKSSNQKIRGPYLARLELYRSVRVNKLETQCLKDDFFDLICEYYQLFGDKPCCTQDVTLFLHDISIAERKDLACRLMSNCKVSNTSLPENKSDMQKHICALQLSRICGTHINFEDVHLLALYTSLKLHYEHGQSLFGNKLLPTELGPSDPYVLLAANVMYDVSVRGKQSKSLFEALCLLQYVLRNSPSNFHVMLASLKIFHMFGCLVGAQEMYEYLDIKQIQLDSMGFIHCNLLPMCGRFTVTRMIFDTTLKFFTTSYKERLEYVAMVYRFCTFTKLEEFMNFKDRLMTSMHYAMISVEAQICDLVTLYNNVQQNLSVFAAMNIDPNEERINWTRLSDNRDLTAITRWEPLSLVNLEIERAESFTQEKEVLQMRLLLLRLIASFVDLMIPSTRKKLGNTIINNMIESTTTNNCKEFETVEHILSLWTAYFKRVRALNYKPLDNEFLANLLPTRLHLLLDLPYEKFFTDVAILMLQLYNGESSLVLQCKQVSEHITQIAQLVTQTIEANNNAADDLWIRRHCQTKVAGCLEIMSLYAFILSVCHEKLQSPPKSVKSRKKSNQNQLQNTCNNSNSNENENSIVSEKERMQMLLELMRHLKNKLQHCDSALRTWKAPVLPSDFNTYLNDMSIKPEIETSIICDLSTTFRESHELMVNELRNLMKDKIRMVSKQGLV